MKNLDSAQTKLAQAEEAKNALSKSLDSANKELTELKNIPPAPAVNSVDWWLREGLCPPKQLVAMPCYIREWAVKNATKWADCRLTWISSGLEGIDKDGSSQFQCSLDHIGPEDGQVMSLMCL